MARSAMCTTCELKGRITSVRSCAFASGRAVAEGRFKAHRKGFQRGVETGRRQVLDLAADASFREPQADFELETG